MLGQIYLKILLVLIVLFILGTLYFFYKGAGVETQIMTPQKVSEVAQEEKAGIKFEITEVAQGMEVPWDLAIVPSGDILITERSGRVKVLRNGQLRTIATLPQVVEVAESGLTGIVLHPNFDRNNFIYLYYTFRDGNLFNRVSRFTFINDELSDEKIIIDRLPGGNIHNGGRLRFGPDGKLYILSGDAGDSSLAQSINSLGGKVLRVSDGGAIPSDNPFKDSPIFSLGHRNPQGLDWHPETQELIITEHGQSAHDEVNLVKIGSNYGWPEVKTCFSDDPRFTNPILCSEEITWAPSGAAFLKGGPKELESSLFFTGLRGQILERVEIKNGKVASRETIIDGTYGRLRAVISDDKGNLYVSTSNKDGRGNPDKSDDRILKITPTI